MHSEGAEPRKHISVLRLQPRGGAPVRRRAGQHARNMASELGACSRAGLDVGYMPLDPTRPKQPQTVASLMEQEVRTAHAELKLDGHLLLPGPPTALKRTSTYTYAETTVAGSSA